MPQLSDIRGYKNKIRARCRSEREKLSPDKKSLLDRDIANKLYRLNQYNNASLLLIYVSTPIEVDTREIITHALAEGKKVAVPRCEDGTRNMDFYRITDMSELTKRTFGVLEPDDNPENLVDDFTDSICIVPALCFDEDGYRLGYGKGYYDRFLQRYKGPKVGICYSSGIRRKLLHGHFDCSVDVIVTEKAIKTTALNKHRAVNKL